MSSMITEADIQKIRERLEGRDTEQLKRIGYLVNCHHKTLARFRAGGGIHSDTLGRLDSAISRHDVAVSAYSKVMGLKP